MPEDVSGNKFPFDLERLRELVEMMEQHGLSEVSLERGDEKLRIRRGGQQELVQVPAMRVPKFRAAKGLKDAVRGLKK